MINRFSQWAILACLLTGLVGCQGNSDGYIPVGGTVKFSDGSCAQFGTIECRSESDNPIIGRGRIQRDGTFKLKSLGGKNGLVRGKHKVVIMQVVTTPKDNPDFVHHHGLEVVDKYRSYETTDLTIEVKPGEDNQFELLVENK